MGEKRAFARHIKWSQEEIELLSLNYPEADFNELKASLPGRSSSQIQNKANGLGIQRKKEPKMSDEERLKRKRDAMARRREVDPVGEAKKRNEWVDRNRDSVNKRNREYLVKRFFWARSLKLKGVGRATEEDLKTLWDIQNGQCGITGRILDRKYAQLDHIIPKSKGGSDRIENLRWTTKEANLMKRDLTDEELLELCSDVMRWIGERVKLEEAR